MLNEKDIEKLIKAQKEVFVTKDEFESYLEIAPTKEDLKGFATKEDIKSLSKQITSLSEDLKKSNNIEMRVEYIENILAVSTKK